MNYKKHACDVPNCSNEDVHDSMGSKCYIHLDYFNIKGVRVLIKYDICAEHSQAIKDFIAGGCKNASESKV